MENYASGQPMLYLFADVKLCLWSTHVIFVANKMISRFYWSFAFSNFMIYASIILLNWPDPTLKSGLAFLISSCLSILLSPLASSLLLQSDMNVLFGYFFFFKILFFVMGHNLC
jgi:hypothetical protein